MKITTTPIESFLTHQWHRDHDHSDAGETLVCNAFLKTGTPEKPGSVLATAQAVWVATMDGWTILRAHSPISGNWPLPPRDMQPRSKILSSENFIPGNFFQVDNIEGSVFIGKIQVNLAGSSPDQHQEGYVRLGTDPNRVKNLAAHLITAANLDLDHDVRPLVGAMLNARKR